MESDERSLTHLQDPAGAVMGRRNAEGRREKSGNKAVEWTLGVDTSNPLLSVQLFPSGIDDSEPRVAHHPIHHHHYDDEQEGDPDHNSGPDTVYAKVEAPQKDNHHKNNKGTAAAQTQMPSTKPKARTLVAGRRLIDGSEVACLRDQSCLPLLTVKGTVGLAASDPRRTPSLHASITHNETMQRWMPGGGAPYNHLGTVRRTTSLHTTGILPQEQIRGLPFHYV